MAVKSRNPRSHKHGLMVSISDKRGLHVYFRKKASGYNNCVGESIRKSGKAGKGAGREAVRAKFRAAVATCAPKYKK